MVEPSAPLPFQDAAPLFAALGDETRLRLLARLSSAGPASITRLSARADVSRQAISKHVRVLVEAGLVQTHREGRERVCELTPGRLGDAHGYLEAISRQWDDALGRLRRFVEEP
jgi:DNA-binding transcriptional ArsR family regulator